MLFSGISSLAWFSLWPEWYGAAGAWRWRVREPNFLMGAATTNITPDGPVALAGQMNTRIAREVRSSLMAAAIALESRAEGKILDQAIIVSCDLGSIPDGMVEGLRQGLRGRLRGFNVDKLFINATHTHNGPVLSEGLYDIRGKDIIQPADYVRFLTERLTDLIIGAWEARKLRRRELGIRSCGSGAEPPCGLRRRACRDVRKD